MSELNTVKKCMEQLEQCHYQDNEKKHRLEDNTAYIIIKNNINNVQGLIGTHLETDKKVYFDICEDWGSVQLSCVVEDEDGNEIGIDPQDYIWEVMLKDV